MMSFLCSIAHFLVYNNRLISLNTSFDGRMKFTWNDAEYVLSSIYLREIYVVSGIKK